MASIQPAELAYILGQPRRATPTIPPGFSAPSSRLGTPGGSRLGTPVTGSVRPALPPGLPPPQHTITPAVPDIHPASRSSTPKKTKKDSTSSKAIETRPEAGKTPTIAKPDLDKPTADSTESVEVTEDRDFELEGRIERKEGKGKTEGKAEGKSKSEGKGKAGEALSTKAENLPSKPSAKAEKSASKVTADTKVTPTPSTPSRGQESPEEKTEAKSSLSTAKRQHPGPLHIPKKEAIISDAPITADSEPAKNPRATSISASASSRPVTPTGVTGSPMKRTAPGIMRITNTPKTETPPVLSAAAAPPTIPTLAQIRSRQPSVASINQPGTPLSEFVSDAASMTSASMSRTNSPPPNSRVGSAPTRSKTKSQARKERQERARQMTEEELGDTNTPTEEPIKQEAIQSRKKKEKKAKAPKPGKTVESTPVDSSEGTPAVEKKVESPVIEVKEEPAPEVAQPVETPKPALTAAGIIAKLEVAGEISHDAVENIFKSYPSGPNDRQIALADVPNRDREYHMEDDMIKAVVESHQAQRLGGEDGRISSRILVTPTGTIMRGLSKEEEDRYLELEARLTSSRPPAKWTQTKDPPTLDLDKIMRGLNIKTVLESAEKLARQQAQQKVQAAAGTPASAHAARVYDEAANYNDEFIMPASPTTPSAPTAAAGSTPTATSLPSSAQAAAVVAAAAATAAAGPAPFGSRYVHLNGVELSDDTGAALGVEVAGKIAGAGGFGLGGRAGVSGLVDVERELNFEKQRANDLTKKLNAAVKRNRRMVASAGH
ncbi:uncharacterized protein K452DRAFT_138362 [Aplosporella prunicola CBS 121167]|uniref:Uncharacterized protein n=1 Tax=Aplosporella prunicola CBS 121167 TaxID=1176127 RepID=A0A6A6B0L9_9PEZI|nr:uncharacterized protein K452DRAFT_139030 [Aplosporella prunicola CBS 121167]XP_033392075.1 uncharacterized protein K452DRAFT_138362 [Aplosporella prunicola CBS 121167]KAF2136261.1 hypothetical protein K452DRAFT_139030 [Aplosporella prunicola CBS 121167]KAF2136357.1 hypothetical protein K452DRAFT_138362 [Aplosporella prunicola CBS 121167]